MSVDRLDIKPVVTGPVVTGPPGLFLENKIPRWNPNYSSYYRTVPYLYRFLDLQLKKKKYSNKFLSDTVVFM